MPPPSESRRLLFADEMRARLVVLLGGRAAEEVAFSGRISTGASDDIRRATDMAYRAVAEYGLSRRVGPLSLAVLKGGGLDGAGFGWGSDEVGRISNYFFGKWETEAGFGFQSQMKEMVQQEVYELLNAALQISKCIILANRDVLNELGHVLEGGFFLHQLCPVSAVSPQLSFLT